MKLLVFSDSHGRHQNILNVLQQHTDATACFFLGDGADTPSAISEAFPSIPLYAVQGNCDPASFEPYEGLAPFGGFLFFYTHGHTFGVKNSLDTLWQTARARGATAALYGHTHIPDYEFRAGIHLFCPGSIAMPRFGAPTYGLITIQAGALRFTICQVG